MTRPSEYKSGTHIGKFKGRVFCETEGGKGEAGDGETIATDDPEEEPWRIDAVATVREKQKNCIITTDKTCNSEGQVQVFASPLINDPQCQVNLVNEDGNVIGSGNKFASGEVSDDETKTITAKTCCGEKKITIQKDECGDGEEEECSLESIVLLENGTKSANYNAENYLPEGESVDGEEFEVEEGDTLRFRVKGSGSGKAIWNGDLLSGKRRGSLITVRVGDTGTDKDLCVSCVSEGEGEDCPDCPEEAGLSTTVDVNDNIETPLSRLNVKVFQAGNQVGIIGASNAGTPWIHERTPATLKADGDDFDWFNGQKKKPKPNNLDLKKTGWRVRTKFADVIQGSKGGAKRLVIVPKKSDIDTTQITATFDDHDPDSDGSGSYTARNDDEKKIGGAIGKYKVLVHLKLERQQNGSKKVDEVTVDEYQSSAGAVKPEEQPGVELTEIVQSDSSDETKKDTLNVGFKAIWRYSTDPERAASTADDIGSIKADVSAEGGEFTGVVAARDDDSFDNTTFGVSASVGIGALGFSVSRQITVSDEEEAAAGSGWLFQTSEDSALSSGQFDFNTLSDSDTIKPFSDTYIQVNSASGGNECCVDAENPVGLYSSKENLVLDGGFQMDKHQVSGRADIDGFPLETKAGYSLGGIAVAKGTTFEAENLTALHLAHPAFLREKAQASVGWNDIRFTVSNVEFDIDDKTDSE